MAEAQAAAEAEKNSDAAEGDATQQPEPADSTDQTTDQQSDQTDNQNTDQIENSDGTADNATDNTDEATDNLTAADALRELLPETLSGTLDLTLSLDPAIDGVDTGNHTVVLPGDTFTVNLPSGLVLSDEMITNTEKGTFDIFQSDAEGNPTTLKIAEGTVKNEGTTLKVTFVEPVETADAENTTAYYVGAPTDGTVPATQTEGKEQIEKLDASIDLKVAVKSELLTDEASELTWTLQTKADDESVKQEATLALPGMAELADQLGVVVPAPVEPQEQEGENGSENPGTTEESDDTAEDNNGKDDAEESDDSNEDSDPILSFLSSLLPTVFSTYELKPFPSEETKTVTLSSTWIDNNDATRRISLDTFKAGLDIEFSWGMVGQDPVKGSLATDYEKLNLTKEQAEAILAGLSVSQSGNVYSATISTLPSDIEYWRVDGEGNKIDPDDEPEQTNKITWTIVDKNEYSDYYRTVEDKEDSTNQYLQLLKDVTFNFAGKLGSDGWETAFSEGDKEYFQWSEYVNNQQTGDSTTVDEAKEKYDLTYGEVTTQEDGSKLATVIGRVPAYGLDGKPIEYQITYTGPNEITDPNIRDWYQASYNNSASSNHGSDVTAMWSGGTLTLTHTGYTDFDATKKWVDNGEDRPATVTYTLWRYSAQLITADASIDPYAAASQVRLDGQFVTLEVGTSENTIDLGEELIKQYPDLYDQLPKYDPEGHPYIYALSEATVPGYDQLFGSVSDNGAVTGDTAPNYESADGNSTITAVSKNWKRNTNDRFVYNDGTLTNYLSDTIPVEQDKTWEIDAFQDQLEGVEVEFTLYKHTADSDDEWVAAVNWDGTPITKTLNNFKSETLTQTISGYYPALGPGGEELEYRWVETNVKQGKNDTKFELVDTNAEDGEVVSTFILTLMDDQNEPQSLEFTSTFDGDTIVNAFANKTEEHAIKLWETADSEGHGSGNFVDYYPDLTASAEEKTATISLYRDNVYIGSYRMDEVTDTIEQSVVSEDKLVGDFADFEGATWLESSPYHIDFKNLPQYSSTGHKYSYIILEQQKEGWTSVSTRDPETNTTTIRNYVPEGHGSVLAVRKEWIDGSDASHRGRVVVQLVAKHDMPGNEDHPEGIKAGQVTEVMPHGNEEVIGGDYNVLLSENYGWFAEFQVPYDDVSIDDFYIIEIGMQRWDNEEGAGYLAYQYGDKLPSYLEDLNEVEGLDTSQYYSNVFDSISGVDDDASWVHVGWEEGGNPRIATDQHVYEVTTGTATMQVSDDPDNTIKVGTVTNRRLGIVDLTATKTWVDTLEDNEKESIRPQAELVLSVASSSPDSDENVFRVEDGVVHVHLPGGNDITVTTDGTTPLTVGTYDGKNESTYDGKPYYVADEDAVHVPVDRKTNESEYKFFSLPKYDGNGTVWNYTVSEIWRTSDHGDYESTSKIGEYVVGDLHFEDSQRFDFANQPVDTVQVSFYKHWRDQYVNEEQKQRPDIYLTLYEISDDNKRDDSGNLIPEKVDGYVNVQWSRVADDWNDPAYDTNYWQKATFSGLPRYDSHGDEIQYYAQESMSISNPAALDYTDVTFSNERMTEAEKESAEEHGFTVNVGSADDTSNASKAVHAGGTFENALNSKLTVNGVKLWSGLPSDFDSADLPEITVYLQRRSASESGNEWIKPEVVKKGDGDTQREDVIWNEEIGVKSAPDYGVEKQQKDAAGNVVSEVVAYTLRFEKDTDSNQWTYVINQSGLDSDGEGFEEGAEALPRYDESGRRYEYRALEAMWGLFGSDSLLGDPEGKDMAQLVIGFFDVHHGETGSFAMTNTYNGESGKLTVKKIFDQTNRVDGDNYPSVTYELYRQYAVKDSDGNDQMKPASPTPVATHTVSADEFKNGKGTVTFSFDDLEIYAPNGTYGTPDVFPDYSGYAASASPSRACRIVFHPSAFLSFPLRYHSM